ncbi:MAG: NAD(P)-binding domain-containing protein [Acidobacteriota bacterium]
MSPATDETTETTRPTASDEAVCVIGAGSSGIAAVKVLHERGIEVVCYEKGSGVGGNWRYRNDNEMSSAYASLHINTSKEKMAYSDFPMPAEYPDYPHHSQILDYFEDYVDHFGFRDVIHFGTEVTAVEPTENGRWRVSVRDSDGEHERVVRAVLVANGHHWAPRLPEFTGSFDGETMHSHFYETPEQLTGRRVLVVGIGNSAVDIACEASRVAEETVLSTRRSAHILPKYAFGRPIDHFTTPAGSRLPLWLQRLGFQLVLRIARGPQDRFGVTEPDHHLLAAHPTISADLLNLVGHGKIRMKPNLERLDGDGVVFVDGSRETIDLVIYCTGYEIRFPFLGDDLVDPRQNDVRLFRNVVHPRVPGLFFIGLVQPLGAIMPLAEAQSVWVARLLRGEAVLPSRARMEREIERDRARIKRRYVKSDRHTIQVDFYPYLEQVQREAARVGG